MILFNIVVFSWLAPVTTSHWELMRLFFQKMAGQGYVVITENYGILLLDIHYRFDTQGTFETPTPVPALKLQLKLVSKGIFKNDKILGKVCIQAWLK